MEETLTDTVKTAADTLAGSGSVSFAGFFDSLKSIDLRDLILSGVIILGALIIGIIFEAIVIRGLKRIAKNTKWEWDDVLINSFRKSFILWFIIGGLYLALEVALSANHVLQDTIQKIIVVLLIFSITVVIARAASGFISLYSRKTAGGIPSTSLFSNLASLIIFIAGAVVILQNLGISITPLITALGIGGLAVALALQDTLSNLFAGFQIIVSRQVRQGDFIRLETGEDGYVTDVKWRNTTIRSPRSTRVFIVPNSKVASSIVTNYSMPRQEMWIRVMVGVSYNSDLEKVEKVTTEVANLLNKEMYSEDFALKPVIRYKEFADSSINFSARLPVKHYMDQFKIRSEFIKRLHKRFKEESIEIPFPIRTVYMHNADRDL